MSAPKTHKIDFFSTKNYKYELPRNCRLHTCNNWNLCFFFQPNLIQLAYPKMNSTRDQRKFLYDIIEKWSFGVYEKTEDALVKARSTFTKVTFFMSNFREINFNYRPVYNVSMPSLHCNTLGSIFCISITPITQMCVYT